MQKICNPVVAILLNAALCTYVAALGATELDLGFTSIFNGTDLDGWEGDPQLWSVQDGAITGTTTDAAPIQGNTFLIWRGGTLADFELRLSFKIVGGNSGIQYRSKILDAKNWVVGGYQADFEAGPTYSGILYEERGRGILAQRGQMTWLQPDGTLRVIGSLGTSEDIQAVLKPADWNDYVVIARGNRLTHVINGRVTVDVTDDQESQAARSGILALQIHTGPSMTVQFKNIRLKPLQ